MALCDVNSTKKQSIEKKYICYIYKLIKKDNYVDFKIVSQFPTFNSLNTALENILVISTSLYVETVRSFWYCQTL